MRERLVQVLKSEDTDRTSDIIARRFWGHAEPRRAEVEGADARSSGAQVVDLERWRRRSGASRP